MFEGKEDEINNLVITHDSRDFTGSQFLVEALHSAGVTHVFGGHGGAVVPLIDAIVAHPSITWVYCRCEVNASQAAAAHAKLSKTLGCCVATSGPGAAHLLSGLIDADQDRVPLICLTGMKALGHLRHSDFQDIDQSSIFRMAGLALSETVSSVDQLMPLVRNAFTTAIAENRCAHLAIPIDVQQGEFVGRRHFCLGMAFKLSLCTPASDLQVEALVTALRSEILSGRRVLIACGYRASGLGALVERIAELMHAPILTSYDGKGTVDEHHPLAYGVVGVYGNAGTSSAVDLLESCQTVIGICITDWTELITDKSGLQVREFFQIDERLVAGDSLRFSPSAVFACGYLRDSLKRVINVFEEHILRSPRISDRRKQRVTITERPTVLGTLEPNSAKDVWSELEKETHVKPTGTPSTLFADKGISNAPEIIDTKHCHPMVFFQKMGGFLDSNTVICADIGDNALFMSSALAAKRGQRFLTSEHLGIMGYAINSGLAASLTSKAKANGGGKLNKTLVVAGDGGIQMSLNELATMQDHGAANVLVVVVVNSRLGRVQNESWGPGLDANGCHIGSPDYVQLFEAYGYPDGMVLSTCDSNVINETIKRGWQLAEKQGCCVIELHQDPKVHPIMHKLEYRKSLHTKPWQDSTRRIDSLLPSIRTDHWKCDTPRVKEWLLKKNELEKSDAYWLDKGDVFQISLSEVVQTMFESLFKEESVPQLFQSSEARKTFDTQYHATMVNAFPAEVLLSEVVSKGTSNSHPIKMQLFACPPNFEFNLHAHPSVELDIPLVGRLWEKYLIGASLDPSLLVRKSPLPESMDGDKLYNKPLDEEVDQVKKALEIDVAEKISHLGKFGEFVDRPNDEGQVLYNEPGSIHQSYTRDGGCLLLVLWAGFGVEIDCNCCKGIKGSESLFLP